MYAYFHGFFRCEYECVCVCTIFFLCVCLFVCMSFMWQTILHFYVRIRPKNISFSPLNAFKIHRNGQYIEFLGKVLTDFEAVANSILSAV